jgi:hypothetical protein
MTTALVLDPAEERILAKALVREHDDMARHRAITECRLAAGEGDAAVLTKLAKYQELDLARLDALVGKLPPNARDTFAALRGVL